ncbi:hypothetical protein X805_30690 [Sphaerotilus natans subsp. natans DSM 6575]|uniref:Uncharacterized protein n=1 Tax=Sphaerotilus natans subsp. natans DSM 6575 TaxID=1286631 RepID=A0A059KJR2_9BURK|nr:hypothetical protein [Sphaerotilus natans]KDB51348.1 hypothetical protein X805_30690 [Sphaerotilus natans subsp. natans DSM 6575]SIR68768.1 hypothetical protein SAMN05421778_11497 [Sphaerotilus natans]
MKTTHTTAAAAALVHGRHPHQIIFGTPLLKRSIVEELDMTYEQIVHALDNPDTCAAALQDWCEAVITGAMMARITGTGVAETDPILDHLQHLINTRTPDGRPVLTDADREQLLHAADVLTAVASITPAEVATLCAQVSTEAMQTGRLPEMLRGGRR